MSLFKKKAKNLPLPPPPVPGGSRLRGDIEPIRSRPAFPEIPRSVPPDLSSVSPRIPPMPNARLEDIAPETPPIPEIPRLPPLPREKEVIPDKLVREPVKRIAPEKAFVAVSEYRKIILSSGEMKARLAEAENHLARLSEIKAQEEKLFERWQSHLESVGKKLTYVDTVIAKAGGK